MCDFNGYRLGSLISTLRSRKRAWRSRWIFSVHGNVFFSLSLFLFFCIIKVQCIYRCILYRLLLIGKETSCTGWNRLFLCFNCCCSLMFFFFSLVLPVYVYNLAYNTFRR